MNRFVAKLGAALCATSFLLTACGSGTTGNSNDSTLRIGVLMSLTGPAASFGIPEKEAIEYLAKQSNAKGGINGHTVKLFIEDDKTDPTEAARATRSLILDDKVDVIIGSTTGSGTLAAAPIAASNKVPMISPVSSIAVTNPKSGFFDYVFRSSTNDQVNVASMLALAKEKGAKRVGLFYQEDALGEGQRDVAREKASEYGLEIAAEASAPATATNVSAQASKLAAANVDVVLVQGSSPVWGAAFMRAKKQIHSKALTIVGGALVTDAFLKASDGAADNAYSAGAVGWDKPSQGQQAFIDSYTAAGKPAPTGFPEAVTGGAYYAIEAAANQIDGTITGEGMKDALEKSTFETLFLGPKGTYTKDKHDSMGPHNGSTMQVANGKWTTMGQSGS